MRHAQNEGRMAIERPPIGARERLRDLAFAVSLQRNRDLWRRHRVLSTAAEGELSDVIVDKYFRGNLEYLRTDEGTVDYWNHMSERLRDDRRRVIPWIASFQPLQGARILEVGSGTGCSTVAFAEQGASIVGIDIDEPALQVAQQRCRLYGLDNVRLVHANVLDRLDVLDRPYDIVIFFASLEHMIHEEWIEALRRARAWTGDGGLIVVVECPNRLWYWDDHTSSLPFFHWLPDDLALAYIARSPRPSMQSLGADMLDLLRRGRGASFHEFELAFEDNFTVTSCLDVFLRRTYPLVMVKQAAPDFLRYRRFLMHFLPRAYLGFSFPYINVAIRAW